MLDVADAFAEVSAIGATSAGGMHRLAASAADGAARDWLCRQMARAGASVHVDRIGNIFGLFEFVPGAPAVLTGSHLDSQPTGGCYDGALGVISALAAAAGIAASAHSGDFVPTRNLVVVDWTNEEGARFQPSLMGSSVFTGAMPLADALATADASGITMADALTTIGYAGAAPFPLDIASYAEIHVEQSDDLEREGVDIGVVTGNWAAYKYTIVAAGEQSHTGATPMAKRRDALLAAGMIIAGVRAIADGQPAGLLHTSVTELRTSPDSPNVVTASASMHVEIRSPEYAALAPAQEQLFAVLEQAARASGSVVEVVQSWHREPTEYWPEGVELAEAAGVRAGVSTARRLTVSGHDSIALNAVVPTVMLFVPSAGGFAHSEREFTSEADLRRGERMLAEVLRELLVS